MEEQIKRRQSSFGAEEEENWKNESSAIQKLVHDFMKVSPYRGLLLYLALV